MAALLSVSLGRSVSGWAGDDTLPIDAAAESGVVITYIVISQTQNSYSKLDSVYDFKGLSSVIGKQ